MTHFSAQNKASFPDCVMVRNAVSFFGRFKMEEGRKNYVAKLCKFGGASGLWLDQNEEIFRNIGFHNSKL